MRKVPSKAPPITGELTAAPPKPKKTKAARDLERILDERPDSQRAIAFRTKLIDAVEPHIPEIIENMMAVIRGESSGSKEGDVARSRVLATIVNNLLTAPDERFDRDSRFRQKEAPPVTPVLFEINMNPPAKDDGHQTIEVKAASNG